MDCAHSQQNETPQKPISSPSVSSPEMFDSDTETETESRGLSQIPEESMKIISPKKPTPAEIVAKSDFYLLNRIHKYLSGVPPPPRHTICQNDYSDFLSKIQENRHLFWTSNSSSDNDKGLDKNISNNSSLTGQERNVARNHLYQHTKNSSRNLTGAFDACDQSNTTLKTNDCDARDNFSNECSSNSETITSINPTLNDTSNTNTFNTPICTNDKSEEHSYLVYNTVNEEGASILTWPDAYMHKFHGIHYNRNKYIEEYENLTMKLCDRYIGAETQSTCNLWFSKQAPGSAKKRRLLSKRDTGQSPGKRLNHLTRRRRTFSSANLQGLALSDRKQLILNIKKSINRKGKSPRGKSPRGKTPKGKTSRGKSPRSSAKKRVVRRLTMEGPSPYKSVLETSKRALFQSPERIAGPSELFIGDATNPQKIKRALFPTPNKKEDYLLSDINKANIEGNRKRKNEDELEGPKLKWAKSLSFDCSHELKNNYNKNPWEQDRHSAGNILSRSNSFSHVKSELSDTHRKKLLWAVAEALRSKGINMSHPQFKQFASSLARTVKKFMPDLENSNIPRKPGRTSDRMLKLAKHHVLFLLDSKTPND